MGIDIDSDNLKLVVVRNLPGRREVVDFVSRYIHGMSEDEVCNAIKSLFEDMKAQNPRLISLIHSNMVISKNIEIPSQNPKEIKEILNLQASRHTPYSREEIIIDYINIGSYRRSYTKLLLVIVSRDSIKKRIEIMSKAGLNIEHIFFSMEGIGRLFAKALKIDSQESPAGIIHIDAGFTDFAIMLKDKIIFIRGIPIGAQHMIAEGEASRLKFIEEIQKSLQAYKGEDIERTPDRLILTGAIEELKDLASVLNEALRIPTQAVSYFNHLPLSAGALKAVSLGNRMSFLGIIAPLLTLDDTRLDLIPEEIKLNRSFKERSEELIKSGILIMAIFVLICGILLSKIYFKSAYLRNLELKYKSQSKDVQRLEKDFSRFKSVKDYLSSRGYSLEVLSELYAILPEDVQLSEIKADEQGKFSIKGTADMMGTVFSLVDSMGKSGNFYDVKTKYTAKRKEGNKDVADFEIICMLNKKSKEE